MRITINLDEQLLNEAWRVTGIQDCATLIHEGLRVLIQRESARRLARLGGSSSQMEGVPRRRQMQGRGEG